MRTIFRNTFITKIRSFFIFVFKYFALYTGAPSNPFSFILLTLSYTSLYVFNNFSSSMKRFIHLASLHFCLSCIYISLYLFLPYFLFMSFSSLDSSLYLFRACSYNLYLLYYFPNIFLLNSYQLYCSNEFLIVFLPPFWW